MLFLPVCCFVAVGLPPLLGEYWGEMGWARVERGDQDTLKLQSSCDWAVGGWTKRNYPCDEGGENSIDGGTTLWSAIRTVIIADAVYSNPTRSAMACRSAPGTHTSPLHTIGTPVKPCAFSRACPCGLCAMFTASKSMLFAERNSFARRQLLQPGW